MRACRVQILEAGDCLKFGFKRMFLTHIETERGIDREDREDRSILFILVHW